MKAGFRQIMVTGDNPLTAVAVAKMAGPAFLCSYRRSLLVDVVASPLPFSEPGTMTESRLIVRDVLDPTLRWDLKAFLLAGLPHGALLGVEEAEGKEEGEDTGGFLSEKRPPDIAEVSQADSSRGWSGWNLTG